MNEASYKPEPEESGRRDLGEDESPVDLSDGGQLPVSLDDFADDETDPDLA